MASGHAACTMDACPQGDDDGAALLQSKVTVDPLTANKEGKDNQQGEEEEDEEKNEVAEEDEEAEEDDKLAVIVGEKSQAGELVDWDKKLEDLMQLAVEGANQGNLSMIARSGLGTEDVIDIDAMIEEQKQEAAENIKILTKKVNDMKPALKQAKDKFKATRKSIRTNFRKCKKKMNKKKWKATKECKPFVNHFSLLENEEREDEKQEEEEEVEEEAESSLEGAVAKTATEDEDREDDSWFFKPCSKRPKCQLRQARRRAKAAAKEKYKQIRSDFRGYKKELRKAKFQKNILPKIITALKPSLLDAIAQVDMGDGAEGMLRGCTLTDTEDCIPLAEIGTEHLLRDYMATKLHATLFPKLYNLFAKIKKKIFDFAKPYMDSIKSSIVTAVGTIPVVGGALAAAVNVLIEVLYYAVKYGIGSALSNVRTLLQNTIVTGVVEAVFATGLFTTAALQDPAQTQNLLTTLEKTAADSQKATVVSTQSSITGPATSAKAQAEKLAAGAQASIVGDGETVEREEEADDNAETADDENEDKQDIDEDED